MPRIIPPLFALLFCQLSSAQDLSSVLQGIATQHGLVGMSVVATCGDEVSNVVHVGQRDIALGLPVNDETRYRIASISKLVTAVGLMKLWEEGAFGLDDDVSTALGFSLRNPAHPTVPITYRMLLGHRSSLQDGTGYTSFLNATYAGTPPPPIQQLVQPGGTWYTANLWRTEVPGTWYAYGNLNYGIIGTLIESHSGMRFDQYMREQVLLPMGILGSYNIQDLGSVADLAVLYRNSISQADNFGGVMPTAPDLGGYTIGSNGLYFAPQGGLRCSALELAQVLRMMHGQGTVDGTTVLQPATWQAMAANEWTWNGNNGDNYFGLFRSWGLGVHRVTATPGGDLVLPGTPMLGHAGEAYGLISDLYLDPATGFGLVFITNGYTPGNNYASGINSAWYRVEEEVFEALGTWALPACLGLGSATTTILDDLLIRERTVEWQGRGPLDVEVLDLAGRSVATKRMEPGARWSLAVGGTLILRATDTTGRTQVRRVP